MAPMTRFRASKEHVVNEAAAEYYSQRATPAGTLLITEGIFIAPKAGGYAHVPGIWSDEQIAVWKRVTDAVHAKGSFIFAQIWALGRTATLEELPEGADVVSSGNVASPAGVYNGGRQPRPLTVEEIDEYVELFAQAARNAVAAGFDGVEVHAANGYLVDQFLRSHVNNRPSSDPYGGPITKRVKFLLRVAQAISAAIGADRTAIRLSPYEKKAGLALPSDQDLVETFGHAVRTLAPLGLAYLHLTEPRSDAEFSRIFHDYSLVAVLIIRNTDNPEEYAPGSHGSFALPEYPDWAQGLYFGRPAAVKAFAQALGVTVEDLPAVEGGAPSPTNVLIRAGGHTPQTAAELTARSFALGEAAIAGFGRNWTSNPDLPTRIIKGINFTPYDRSTFYTPESLEGYTTFAPAAVQA